MKNSIKIKLIINRRVNILKFKIKNQPSKIIKDKLSKKKYCHYSFNNLKMLINF